MNIGVLVVICLWSFARTGIPVDATPTSIIFCLSNIQDDLAFRYRLSHAVLETGRSKDSWSSLIKIQTPVIRFVVDLL